ncbi:MAG: RNA polymerase sigma-70 factor [Spirosomataceae bacterium]
MNALLDSDIDLLNRLKSHDNEAFERLYRKYWRSLYDYVYAKTSDTDVAEELIQDLFVTLWEKRQTLQIGHLQNYLFTSAKNRVIDHYKQKIFEQLDNIQPPAITANYTLFLDELENALQESVAQLPPKTQEIFKLNRLEDKTARQISEELQLPQRTVEYHITQAIRLLKIQLKDYIFTFMVLFVNNTF